MIVATRKPRSLLFAFSMTFAACVGLLPLAAQPAQATGSGDAIAVVAGHSHTCVLKATHNVFCWGDTSQVTNYNGGDALAVSSGTGASFCILTAAHNVKCWNGSYWGWIYYYSGGDATAVASGTSHSCALKAGGSVDCWGSSSYGEASDRYGTDATAIALGDHHTCALLVTGNVDCWGQNYYGQANDYTGGDAIAVAAGMETTCILKATGGVHCWGDTFYGADYTGVDGSGVAQGDQFTCVLKVTRNVHCWGSNGYGQASDYNGADATAVSAGIAHACVLQATGYVHCWGWNAYGQANDYNDKPFPPNNVVATPGPSPGQIRLTWTTPSGDGGSPITGYNVYRGAISGGEIPLASPGNVYSYTDGGHGNGETYYYQVTAVNANGESPKSSEVSAMTPTVPGTPQYLSATPGPGNGQVTLTWQAPASNGGYAISTYKVYAGSSPGSEAWVASPGNVLTYTESGLGEGVTRYYKVSATNAMGEGALTGEVGATTFAKPGAPQALSALPGPDVGQITLSWQPPLSDGGRPITYNVYRGAATGLESFLANVGSDLTYADSGCLTAICFYTVTAVNSVGEGPASNEVVSTVGIVPPVLSTTVRDDDGTAEAATVVDTASHYASKSLDIPYGAMQGVTSAKLWVYAHSDGCANFVFSASGAQPQTLYANYVPVASFDPCYAFAPTDAWVSFDIPLGDLYAWGSNQFSIYDNGAATGNYLNLQPVTNAGAYAVDTDSSGASSMCCSGVDGELLWYLELGRLP